MIHSRKIMSAYVVAAAVLTSGCATILNDKTQTINIAASNGAAIDGTVNGMPFKGPLPVSVLRQKEALRIATTTPNCAPMTVKDSSIDGVFWINIITGGFFGSTTDYASGEMWKYESTVVIPCGN